MEDNKKAIAFKRGRKNFNILDAIIIVAMLFVLASVVMMIIPNFNLSALNGEAVKITYTVVFRNVDESVYDKINANENVIDVASGSVIGVVSQAPESELSYEFVISEENGSNVAKRDHGEDLGMDITVEISATATYKEGLGFTVDGYRIASGKEMNLRFADFACVGYCESVTVVGSGN